jgi:hypothetical protein
MWDWLRRGAGHASASVPQFAPGTQIAFDAGLVSRLSGDHRRLLHELGAIRVAVVTRRRGEVLVHVRALHRALARHLTDETVLLYTYLEHSLGPSTPAGSAVRQMHVGMASIGRVVSAFFEAHSRRELEPQELDGFSAEFESIAAALVARIRREESTLYPLYRAPADHACVSDARERSDR